jgi:hypothetical protein
MLKEEGNVDVVITHVNRSQLQFRGKGEGEGERYASPSQFHPLRRYFSTFKEPRNRFRPPM